MFVRSTSRPAPSSRHDRWRRRGRVALVTVTLLAGSAVLVPPAGPARADTAPPDSSTLATVSSDPLPTVQVNGVVWQQAIAGGTVYAGGNFATARPAGAAPGASTVPRTHLLAYDLASGALRTNFAPTLNGEVRAVALSPDGSTLYVGGDFTTINGSTRNRLAAFDVASGALKPTFLPYANAEVKAIAVTASGVYIAGNFSNVGNVAHTSIAAVNPTSGAVLSFNPIVSGGYGESITLSPQGDKVVIGGRFDHVNSSTSPGYGMAIVDAATGKVNYPMSVNTIVRNAHDRAAITNLFTASDGFYGTAFTFSGVDGNFEGTFKANWNGDLTWLEDCHGDTYAAWQAPDITTPVYIAGHPHYCGNLGGFPDTNPRVHHRSLAFTPNVKGTLSWDSQNYTNFNGRSRPDLLTWFPDLNSGTYTGQNQGPWTVTGTSDYVLYGGEFTTVNNTGQQGLVRFARSSLAPNQDRPRLQGSNFIPTLQSFADGIRVSWASNYDRDNEQLSYAVIRDGVEAHPIFTTLSRSTFWQQPELSFLDTSVVPGSTYNYRITATDPFGHTAGGADVAITFSGGPTLSTYDRAVLGDSPTSYWRLDDNSGSSVVDSAAGAGSGTRQSAVQVGVPGAITGDPGTAYHFPGNSTGYASTTTAVPGPQVYSVETWFKSNPGSGGRLIGFSSSATGNSSASDRHLYLTNAGRIYFGISRPAQSNTNLQTISSPSTGYNNGQWHYVVATQDLSGIKLFVDGTQVAARSDYFAARVFSGYWRLGGDQLNGWPESPSSTYLNGDLDDAAVYNTALTPTQITAHYANARNLPNTPPVAAFTSSCTFLVCSFNGSGSNDPDGSITGYAWSFGDGATGSGATTTHTYAAPGTFTAQLTVTDNRGATGVVTHPVTTTVPAGQTFASDTFNRTVPNGFGTADVGGAWTASSSGNEVLGGAGLFKLASAGLGPIAYLDGARRTDVDVTLNATVDKAGTGGGIYLTAYGRRVSSTLDYRTTVKLTSTATAVVTLAALRDSNNVTTLSTVTLPDVVAPGDTFHIRLQVVGTGTTTLRVKVWRNGAAEPASWTSTATDTYANLQVPGAVGMQGYLSGSATNAPVQISLLDLVAKPS